MLSWSQQEALVERLALAARASCAGSISRSATLARCTHWPLADQLTLRGGICGCATKATPPSPKSARQTAFQVARAFGCSPRSSAADVDRGRGDHRFDHEAGLWRADGNRCRPDRRDGDADADAEHVRDRSGCAGTCRSTRSRAGSPASPCPCIADTPRKAGSIIEKPNGSSWVLRDRTGRRPLPPPTSSPPTPASPWRW